MILEQRLREQLHAHLPGAVRRADVRIERGDQELLAARRIEFVERACYQRVTRILGA